MQTRGVARYFALVLFLCVKPLGQMGGGLAVPHCPRAGVDPLARTRGSPEMSDRDLEELVRQAKDWPVSDSEREEQRRSFAYGNTHFENERITRATVDRAADSLKPGDAKN